MKLKVKAKLAEDERIKAQAENGSKSVVSYELRNAIINTILSKVEIITKIKRLKKKKELRMEKERKGIPSYLFSSTLFLRNSCMATKDFLVFL